MVKQQHSRTGRRGRGCLQSRGAYGSRCDQDAAEYRGAWRWAGGEIRAEGADIPAQRASHPGRPGSWWATGQRSRVAAEQSSACACGAHPRPRKCPPRISAPPCRLGMRAGLVAVSRVNLRYVVERMSWGAEAGGEQTGEVKMGRIELEADLREARPLLTARRSCGGGNVLAPRGTASSLNTTLHCEPASTH